MINIIKNNLKLTLPNIFIIFDTEYTAWEGSQERNWSGKNEYMELVQVGALKVEKKKDCLDIKEVFSIYTKPEINPILSQYFIDLTNITQETVDTQGVSFSKSMQLFYKFCKDNHGNKLPLYSYGNDYGIIKYNLDLKKTPIRSKFRTWEPFFYDIREIFKDYVDVSKYISGTLYKAFNIKPNSKIEIHNSLWDSLSIFLSLNKIYLVS
jgi:inhibitor of KinA sporulation pathway (predicted exonuclease)